MIKYKRNKLKQNDISEAYNEYWEMYADWFDEYYYDHEYYLEEESRKIGYKISHDVDKEVIIRNKRYYPKFNNSRRISYGVVDMESFYPIDKMRDKKIDLILDDVEDLSNKIENILKEKQNGKSNK